MWILQIFPGVPVVARTRSFGIANFVQDQSRNGLFKMDINYGGDSFLNSTICNQISRELFLAASESGDVNRHFGRGTLFRYQIIKMQIVWMTAVSAFLAVLLPAAVAGQVTDCSVGEGWGVRLFPLGVGV